MPMQRVNNLVRCVRQSDRHWFLVKSEKRHQQALGGLTLRMRSSAPALIFTEVTSNSASFRGSGGNFKDLHWTSEYIMGKASLVDTRWPVMITLGLACFQKRDALLHVDDAVVCLCV